MNSIQNLILKFEPNGARMNCETFYDTAIMIMLPRSSYPKKHKWFCTYVFSVPVCKQLKAQWGTLLSSVGDGFRGCKGSNVNSSIATKDKSCGKGSISQ